MATSPRVLRKSFATWALFYIGGLLAKDATGTVTAFIHRPLGGLCTATPHLLARHTTHDIDIPIIYENEKLLAINKPPHIPHHDDPSNGQLGILSLIRTQQQQSNSPFSYPHRLYGVHRLDKVTSGILLLAKDSATASMLVNKFRRKEITKYYMAISGKKPKKKKQGWVKGIMNLGRRGSYKLVNPSSQSEVDSKEGVAEELGDNDEVFVSKDRDRLEKNDKRYAVTRFFTAGLGNLPLAPFLLDTRKCNSGADDQPIPKSAILFQPQTGKTHQLRVAAKSLAIPILGDIRYGGGRLCASKGADFNEDATDDWDRTYLHSSVMHFHFNENENVTIWSPPPFAHLFSSSELNEIFIGMMEKHCDCPQILHATRKTATDQSGSH
eukprot:CAMPEP_0181094834 /NCGR_PEP_ID=MMETSP1071-20121207/10200_1 /TAXON_ID=35127 /ORGANISM="Thalassiosira sp., Strain NH16" /LENGTH=381 /DNA_ID=CAMNT_0023177181 /DNA_START=131 /DNA_END=1276 /DNA_ORIENTATION=+